MAIRSLIARHNRDGSFDSITVSFGDPAWIGPLLVRHYAMDVRVNALIALGSLSHLDREIGVKQDFEHPHSGWCVAYGRDREEGRTGARHSETLPDLADYARRLFVDHLFVWTIHPRTGEKAWAMVPLPVETESSLCALVEDLWRRHRQGGTALPGITGEIE